MRHGSDLLNRLAAAVVTLLAIGMTSSCRDGVAPGHASGRVVWRVPSGPSANVRGHAPTTTPDGTVAWFLTSDWHLKKIRGSDGVVLLDRRLGPEGGNYPDWNLVLSGGNIIAPMVHLEAFDTITGAVKWKYIQQGKDIAGNNPVAVDDSTVYAATPAGFLHAIDSRTGIRRWRTDLSLSRSDVGALDPVLYGGAVFVCSLTTAVPDTAAFWAVDAATGAIRWRHDVVPELPGQPPMCYGDPTAYNNLVIQPMGDGRIIAFDTASGTVRWIAPRLTQFGDTRKVEARGGFLIATSEGADRGLVMSLDPSTGAERWRNDVVGAPRHKPVLDDSTAYVMHADALVAYDLRTGRMRWRSNSGAESQNWKLSQRPALGVNRVFAASPDFSYAFRK